MSIVAAVSSFLLSWALGYVLGSKVRMVRSALYAV